MTFLDHAKDALSKLPVPSRKMSMKIPPVGSGHVMHEEEMIVSKPVIILHAGQVFFNFLAMACFASVAAFQAKFHVGPSGLSGFTLFITIAGMLLSGFMLLVPVIYEKYDRFTNLARALKEVRVGFILTGIGTTFSLLISFIVTISAWSQPGCKNAKNDPHAKEGGDDFVKGLPGWCSTKKAAAIFLWLAFGFWLGSMTLLIIQWRQGKLLGPRDPPFQPPTGMHDHDEDDDDLEGSYAHIPPARENENRFPSSGGYTDPHSPGYGRTDNSNIPTSPFNDANRYNGGAAASGRPSMDAYGAFSDPAPSGYGNTGYSDRPAGGAGGGGGAPPSIPEPDLGPQVSRTMQYAASDPYAAVRASIAGQQQPGSGSHTPPSYDYQGYR